jgi:eukaryotic-like serine/threonine-protein kinase
VLAFRSGVRQVEELAWVDRSGKRIGRIGERSDLNTFMLSRDERRIAIVRAETDKGGYQDDVWVQDVSQAAASRLTFGPEPGWSYPVWSPDSKDLFYSTSNAVGVTAYEIRRKPANMVGVNELLMRGDRLLVVWDVSPDGKWLLLSTDKLELLPLTGADRKPTKFSPTDAGQASGQFSPDGRWIAYSGGEMPGRRYIYVQPFPATGAKWQISGEGALFPRWRKDGKELFFHTTDGQIMAAAIKTDSRGSLEHGAPQALFPLAASELYYHYQPSADGQRFLVLVPAAGEKPAPINVVLNWESEH